MIPTLALTLVVLTLAALAAWAVVHGGRRRNEPVEYVTYVIHDDGRREIIKRGDAAVCREAAITGAFTYRLPCVATRYRDYQRREATGAAS